MEGYFSESKQIVNTALFVLSNFKKVSSREIEVFITLPSCSLKIEYQNAVGTPTLVRKDEPPCASAMTS